MTTLTPARVLPNASAHIIGHDGRYGFHGAVLTIGKIAQ